MPRTAITIHLRDGAMRADSFGATAIIRDVLLPIEPARSAAMLGPARAGEGGDFSTLACAIDRAPPACRAHTFAGTTSPK